MEVLLDELYSIPNLKRLLFKAASLRSLFSAIHLISTWSFFSVLDELGLEMSSLPTFFPSHLILLTA